MNIQQILKQYWGFDSFRPVQEEIIQSVLDGKDTLALLPTGGGKSVCFQVPAMSKEGLCIVISPLIALIKDQVENLKQKGIPALAIYSGMSFIEIKKTLENALHGNFKFLYVSPERLETNFFLEYLPSLNVNLIAVDEAHCISQWGYDFRPSYLHIVNVREHLPGIPVLALTASATREIQNDICEKLLFGKNHSRFQKSFERPNLSYSVFKVDSKHNKLIEILTRVEGSSIVYSKTRRHTKEIAETLQMHGISADYYHAGLNHEQRSSRQENWLKNKTRVIVSTNAFGMGIDKPDVRTVVHFDAPECVENYYQEAGRAGRDEKRAYAVLLYTKRDLDDLKSQITIRFPEPEEIKKVYLGLMNYLQVAAGKGENLCFDFDLVDFSNKFKLNVLTVTYAIQTLEQEELLSFNEVFFKPSTVVFTANRNDLNEFEKRHPESDELVKALLRSYEGIYDFPCPVYEKQLAKFLKKPEEIIKKQLTQLMQFGVLDYMPQKDKPQIILLGNRVFSDGFQLNSSNYFDRKERYEKRVQEMINYMIGTSRCRSRFIADYFSSPIFRDCGICDICLRTKNLNISKQEFEHISKKIFDSLSVNNMNYKSLSDKLKEINKDKFRKVLNFLIAEKKLETDANGILQIPFSGR